MTATRPRAPSPGYQIFILTLSLYALAMLAAQSVLRLTPGTRAILDYADYAVCGVFLLDFVGSLVRAPQPGRYLLTWGWLDLLSSFPTIDIARWGRIARVLRVFRVLRGLRATRVLVAVVVKRRAENTFLAASLVALLLVVFCSVAILHFETDPGSNIRTPDDAVWWALTTITTVGYGDRYPVTGEGRAIATILMAGGVGLFGVFSGFLASWFLGANASDESPSELALLRDEVSALRTTVSKLAQRDPTAPGALEPQ